MVANKTAAAAQKPQREEGEAPTAEEGADSAITNNFADAVKKLLKRGKDRGYVTVDEMNAALPPERVSSEQIEDVLAQLSELGINVVEAEDADEEAEEKGSEDYGRTDDPVRLYLREMGQVELLSREGEIAIAKRIEAGREMMIGGICESPLTIQAILDWNDALKDGRLLLRDIVDLEAMQEGDSDIPAAAVEGAPEAEEAEETPAEGVEGEGADISGFDDEDNISLAAIEEKLKPQVVEIFDAIAGTYKKLAKAQHARMEAMSKGEPMPKGSDEKITSLKRDLVDLVRTVRFNNARLEQLVQQLYTLNRRLMGMEGKVLRMALDVGLSREDFLERYYGHELDPNFYEHVMMEPPPPPPPPPPSEMTDRDRLIAGAVVRRERPLTRAERKRMEQEQKIAAKQAEKDRIIAEKAAKKAAKVAEKDAAKQAKEQAKLAAADLKAREAEKARALKEKLAAKKAAEREKADAKREREREKKEAMREKAEAKREAERKKKEALRIKKEKERVLKQKLADQKAKKLEAERKKKAAASKKKPAKKPAPKKPAKKAVKKTAKKSPAKKKPMKKRR